MVAALLVHGLPANASSGQTGSAAAAASPTTPAPASTRSAFPAPLPGAVVFASQAGHDVLALGVVPGKAKSLLQASLVSTEPAKRLSVQFRVTGAHGQARGRGRDAVRAGLLPGERRRGEARAGHRRADRIQAGGLHDARRLAAAAERAAIIARAAKVWRSLNTLVFQDSYGDGHATLRTVWKVVAPDRLSYRILTSGEQSIVIGDRRWIKPSGSKRWSAYDQQPVTQPVPFWSSAVDAHILGTVSVHGQPAWKVSFFDSPEAPGWFTILVDKQTTHTMDMRMTATAHFMHDTYGPFNGPSRSCRPARNTAAAWRPPRRELWTMARNATRSSSCFGVSDAPPSGGMAFEYPGAMYAAGVVIDSLVNATSGFPAFAAAAFRVSRSGPTAPVVPAGVNLWQEPHGAELEDGLAGHRVAGRRRSARRLGRSRGRRRAPGRFGLLLLLGEDQHRRDHRHEEGDADDDVPAQPLTREVRSAPGGPTPRRARRR